MDGIDLSTCNYVIIIGSDTSFVMFFHFVIFYDSKTTPLQFFYLKKFSWIFFYDLPYLLLYEFLIVVLIDELLPRDFYPIAKLKTILFFRVEKT